MSENADEASDRKSPGESQVRSHKGKLERGWRKGALIRELAEGERSQVALAGQYGVVQSSISEFAARHADEIAFVRENLEDEFAGIWVAKKTNRLREYEADLERIADALDVPDSGGMEEKDLIAAKHRALRAVAEELGQLPNRMSVSAEVQTRVTYTVPGVDVSDLR